LAFVIYWDISAAAVQICWAVVQTATRWEELVKNDHAAEGSTFFSQWSTCLYHHQNPSNIPFGPFAHSQKDCHGTHHGPSAPLSDLQLDKALVKAVPYPW